MVRTEPRSLRAGALVLALVASSAATAVSRFEVIDGSLLDHDTGLLWQALSATAGDPLPLDPDLGLWRVATGNELNNVLSVFLDGPIAKTSDTFQALSYFAADQPCAVSVVDECFSGWWHDNASVQPGDPAYYNIAFYNYTAIPGDSDHVYAQSTTTLGSYTQDNCSPLCDSGAGLFTVRMIPEPTTVALMLAGLVGLGLHRGARRPQRLG